MVGEINCGGAFLCCKKVIKIYLHPLSLFPPPPQKKKKKDQPYKKLRIGSPVFCFFLSTRQPKTLAI